MTDGGQEIKQQHKEKGRQQKLAPFSFTQTARGLQIPANTDGEVAAHHVFACGDSAKDRPRVSGRSHGIWGNGVEGVLHVEVGGHDRAVAEGDLLGEGEVHGAEAGILWLGIVSLSSSVNLDVGPATEPVFFFNDTPTTESVIG